MAYRRFNIKQELSRMARGETPTVAAWLVCRLALDCIEAAEKREQNRTANPLDQEIVLTTREPLLPGEPPEIGL